VDSVQVHLCILPLDSSHQDYLEFFSSKHNFWQSLAHSQWKLVRLPWHIQIDHSVSEAHSRDNRLVDRNLDYKSKEIRTNFRIWEFQTVHHSFPLVERFLQRISIPLPVVLVVAVILSHTNTIGDREERLGSCDSTLRKPVSM